MNFSKDIHTIAGIMHCSIPAVDVQGKTFSVGQKVARAIGSRSGSAWIEVQEVTGVCEEEGRVYLAGSKQPMKYPERLAIISATVAQ